MSADEARAEAERRYSFTEGYERGVYSRRAFVTGAEWQASRPFTEEDVEAVAIALHDADEVRVGPWQFCRDKEAHRKQARAALDAVTARHNPETGGSK